MHLCLRAGNTRDVDCRVEGELITGAANAEPASTSAAGAGASSASAGARAREPGGLDMATTEDGKEEQRYKEENCVS